MKKSMLLALLGLMACSTEPKTPGDRVEHGLLERKAEFRRCYEDGLAQSKKSFGGKVMTYFVIGADGKVSGAKVQSTTLNQPQVEGCILRNIQKIRFPAPEEGGRMEVTYPFNFSPN